MQIVEGLSKENVDKLSEILNDEDVTDELLERIKKFKRKSSLKSSMSDDKLNKYLDNHGLSEKDIKYSKKETLADLFIDIFSDKEGSTVLSDIVEHGGLIKWEDFVNGNNIYDICKDFVDEAKELMWVLPKATKTSANMGPAEVLLRFIINESTNPEKGDVAVNIDDKKLEIELKRGDSDGGRPLGQTGTIQNMSVVNKVVFDELLVKHCDVNEADLLKMFKDAGETPTKENKTIGLFQTNKTSAIIADKIKNIDSKLIAAAFIKGVYEQYSEPSGVNTKKILTNLTKYISSNKIDNKLLLDIIGYLQLYFYSQVEKFNYLCVFKPKDGSYTVMTNEQLSDANIVLNKLTFGATSSGTGRERVGRIKLRK